MIRYAKRISPDSYAVVVGLGGDAAYYEERGFTPQDVEESPSGGWYLAGHVPPPVLTVADYDAAMEAHLKAEREARGYTSREPSDYAGSSVARWAQDAADWISHRDAVMIYALGVINHYTETGEAPTLDEFKAALPAIEWTINE